MFKKYKINYFFILIIIIFYILEYIYNNNTEKLENNIIHNNKFLNNKYNNDILNQKTNINNNDILFNNNLSVNNNKINELDDNLKLYNQKCSLDCCGRNQWSPLSDPNYNTLTKNMNNDLGHWVNNNNYVGSNFSCNNGEKGNGCVCMTKELLHNLETHGGNLRL
jgi:hypothetical protein